MTLASYITPRGFLTGSAASEAIAAGWAWPLHGNAAAFTAIDISVREGQGRKRLGAFARKAYDQNVYAFNDALRGAVDAQLVACAARPKVFAGLTESPTVMGILNVTPDSFSDGGAHATSEAAIAHAVSMAEAGAHIIDVGGESTRPGAAPIDTADEMNRVMPVVTALIQRGLCVSIDTRHAAVMRAAVTAGARVVNDVTALTGDVDALTAVAQSGASVILMHMQGTPQTMQVNPTYAWAPGDVFDFLAQRVAVCVAAGIARERIAVDPGIGFGKTPEHSAEILDHLAMFHGLGCPIVVGASRKRFIASLSQGEAVDARLPGSVAAALHAVAQGVQIVRVHDVAATRQALAVAGRLAGRA